MALPSAAIITGQLYVTEDDYYYWVMQPVSIYQSTWLLTATYPFLSKIRKQ